MHVPSKLKISWFPPKSDVSRRDFVPIRAGWTGGGDQRLRCHVSRRVSRKRRWDQLGEAKGIFRPSIRVATAAKSG